MKEVRDQLEAVLGMYERVDQHLDGLRTKIDRNFTSEREKDAAKEDIADLQRDLDAQICDARRVLREWDLAQALAEKKRATRTLRSVVIADFTSSTLYSAQRSGLTWLEGRAAMSAAVSVMRHVDRYHSITQPQIEEISHGAIAQVLNGDKQ